jgi:hypothetical protein
MTEKDQYGIQCSQLESLLPDALDGLLPEETAQNLELHAEGCPVCGPMLSEARQGMFWLRSLAEVEPPNNLVHNILAATSAPEACRENAKAQGAKPGWISGVWKAVRPVVIGVAQPRFVTSFSMAFFSLTLTLTLAGVRLKDLAHIDWRPSALRKTVVLQYTQVETRVVKYYKNMRLVYEIESRVRELRKATEPSTSDQLPQPEQPKEREKRNKRDNSGRPQPRQDNYSREKDASVIAYVKTGNEGA